MEYAKKHQYARQVARYMLCHRCTSRGIDCEGLDLEVLKTINFQTCRFRVVCIEDFDYDDNNKESAINSYMENQGYKLVSRKTVSSIYSAV